MSSVGQKADLAISLIERASYKVPQLAQKLRNSTQPDERTLERAKELLGSLMEFFLEEAPDREWWKDYFTVTGEHMQLTEEGWIPASENTREATGVESLEVLFEVNAPAKD